MTKMSAYSYKAHREYMGLSQEALAARLGVSRETILRRESGALKINEESALAILKLINADNGSQLDSDRIDFLSDDGGAITSAAQKYVRRSWDRNFTFRQAVDAAMIASNLSSTAES